MAYRGNAARQQPAEDADRLANAFQIAIRQLNGQRDRFEAPKFDGSEDVEMFIKNIMMWPKPLTGIPRPHI